MRAYQIEFIELALEIEVLKFGQFKLKSERISPYFFNSGLFNTGYAAAKLARCYSAAVEDLQRDMLFGPAYKGIPLVALTAAALAEHHGIDLPFCFNRKEAKQHGEGGAIIGAPVSGRVLILDDVITAGTIALDRQERGENQMSAVDEIQVQYGIPVASIIKLDDLIEHLETSAEHGDFLPIVEEYRQRYGT
jgi:orotate phosphoribosyltransferase